MVEKRLFTREEATKFLTEALRKGIRGLEKELKKASPGAKEMVRDVIKCASTDLKMVELLTEAEKEGVSRKLILHNFLITWMSINMNQPEEAEKLIKGFIDTMDDWMISQQTAQEKLH